MTRGTRRIARWVLTIAAIAAVSATPAGAAPADRATALAQYAAVQTDEAVGAGWTGAVAGCVVGSESAESQAATLRTVNALRSFAGLAPVTFDADKSARALAAALMMKAADSLSHSPGTDWPCYSADGAAGAGTSNLFLGESGPTAMVGYIDDGGVGSLGHRRWLLDPGATEFGSGSTGTSNALLVIGGSRAVVAPGTVVVWPPAGWVPWQWVFSDWSASIGNGSQQVSLSAAQVAVTIDGTPAAVDGVADIGSGFGTGRVLRWGVAVPDALRSADHHVDVTITGVTLDGAALPLHYAFDGFQPEPPKPATPPPPQVRFGVLPYIQRSDGRRRAIRPGVRVKAVYRAVNAARITLRWLRDGRPLAGATASMRIVRRSDRGRLLSCRITLSAADGSGATATTAPIRIPRR